MIEPIGRIIGGMGGVEIVQQRLSPNVGIGRTRSGKRPLSPGGLKSMAGKFMQGI